jgi:hypothetical protein
MKAVIVIDCCFDINVRRGKPHLVFMYKLMQQTVNRQNGEYTFFTIWKGTIVFLFQYRNIINPESVRS